MHYLQLLIAISNLQLSGLCSFEWLLSGLTSIKLNSKLQSRLIASLPASMPLRELCVSKKSVKLPLLKLTGRRLSENPSKRQTAHICVQSLKKEKFITWRR